MELINENDLQNVCGGSSCKDVASAVIAAGTVLVVCGLAVYSLINGDLKIKTTVEIPVVKHTIVTEKTYTTYTF